MDFIDKHLDDHEDKEKQSEDRQMREASGLVDENVHHGDQRFGDVGGHTGTSKGHW